VYSYSTDVLKQPNLSSVHEITEQSKQRAKTGNRKITTTNANLAIKQMISLGKRERFR
jgi:hypothetical protein